MFQLNWAPNQCEPDQVRINLCTTTIAVTIYPPDYCSWNDHVSSCEGDDSFVFTQVCCVVISNRSVPWTRLFTLSSRWLIRLLALRRKSLQAWIVKCKMVSGKAYCSSSSDVPWCAIERVPFSCLTWPCLCKAFDLLEKSEKQEYQQARDIVPSLVASETPFLPFLQREAFQPLPAARCLALYWKKRKRYFGDRWL